MSEAVKNIPLGSRVRCKITHFEGFVRFRIEHLNHCIRYGVQPRIDKKEVKLPDTKILDEPNLEIIAPPKKGLPSPEIPNAFELGVKVKDILTGFEGIVVARIKNMSSGDRYGVQAPVDKKGDIPEPETFDEEDLIQTYPVPTKKKKKEEDVPPNGPHDPNKLVAR